MAMNGDPADLSKLQDIVMPAAVAWWPPAPGWWIVGAGVLAILVVSFLHAYRRFRADAYRREAIRELDRLSSAAGVMPVLKRAAMVAYGREVVASVSGDAFLAFLDRTGGTVAFTTGPARLLPGAAFMGKTAPTAADAAAAVAEAKRWLRTHRTEE
jgi:Domain of unknown function (DUF4381)